MCVEDGKESGFCLSEGILGVRECEKERERERGID
jgi:hypothetical protein